MIECTVAAVIVPHVDGLLGPQLMLRALDVSTFLVDVAAMIDAQDEDVCAACVLRAVAGRLVTGADQLTP